MSESQPLDQPIDIAGYRIDRVLGSGGMSVVYLAHKPAVHQWAALKVLRGDLARNADIRARFLREGETTARLAHPNVVATYGRGETSDGQLWIAMQYVKGTDAESALRAAGAMDPVRALGIVTQVAEVLDYAHSCGVVHQDIKPSNILLGERLDGRERVVLADFGAAVVLATAERESGGALVASFAYTAPEVITGDTGVDGRADVYSLGCTLFRLVTGSVPFPGHSTAAAMAHAHLTQAAPKPSEFVPGLPPELNEVVAKALAKRPEDRYASAGELASAVAHALRPSHARPPSPAAAPLPPRVWVTPMEANAHPRHRSRRVIIVGSVAAAAVLIAIVVAWLIFPSHDDTAATIPPPASTSHAPPPTVALPAGYPPGACTRADATDPATDVVMTCGPNRDPGGPISGTYSVARDARSLQNALARVIGSATTVVCPGNIQSPGPWRHLADPATPQGTLFCGIGSDGRPLIAWTLDTDRFLAVVESPSLDAAGLNELSTWWASHS